MKTRVGEFYFWIVIYLSMPEVFMQKYAPKRTVMEFKYL